MLIDCASLVFKHCHSLKTLDTIGNCQRPVLSFGVSQHMHKITNLWKFELNWSLKLRHNNESKSTLVRRSCVLSDAWFRDPQNLILRSRNQTWENNFFLEKYVTSEGAVSHNVLHYQPLPITLYQVRFYANNYFESLPIVSTAFIKRAILFPHLCGTEMVPIMFEYVRDLHCLLVQRCFRES